ncbi:MAG TPA: DUF481 domain-containing protein, partial [Thermoanaerobaculia bacterium]|nr:DUF481 domain-containing protein [Thermoanaerobaculia bacterium]
LTRCLRHILLVSVFTAGVALAETPDCPCPTPPPGPPPPWSGSAEFSFLSTSGNTSTESIGGALETDYKAAPWGAVFKAAYLRASTNAVLTAEQFDASLKGSRDLTERVSVFVGTGYLKNRFAGLNSLISGEAGAGYKILAGPEHLLGAEAGLGYVRENRLTGGNRSYVSGRAGLSYKWQFSKSAAFTNDLSYLHDFGDLSNWTISEKAAITADLTSVFALKASYGLLYRNEPVPTFRKTDTVTAVAIVAKF